MTLTKPPLGLKPKYIAHLQRYEEVKNAIERYVVVEMKIPVEWVEEYNETL